MDDELPTDADGNYRLFTTEEMAAWTDGDDETFYTFGQSTPGCMVLLVALGTLVAGGLFVWFR